MQCFNELKIFFLNVNQNLICIQLLSKYARRQKLCVFETHDCQTHKTNYTSTVPQLLSHDEQQHLYLFLIAA